MPRAKGGWLACVVVVVTAFAVYLRTLLPGQSGLLDTPVFQFLGRVLGVAHNPGYPLYSIVGFFFSYVPAGTLAYRANLFSAAMGALAAGLTFLISRRLGASILTSTVVAFGLAFGRTFWSQAVIAEVYTFDAALTAVVLLLGLRWIDTRRPRDFFVTVAVLAIGVGNRTTILSLAPALAIAALLHDPKFAIRPRTVLLSAVLMLAGLLQYGFILIRSATPGAYVESPATTLPELVNVMRGTQFAHALFMFSWRHVLFERLPWIVRDMLVPEMTLFGLVLAGVGIFLVLRRFQKAVAGLLLTGATLVFAFALNYATSDTNVVMIPAMLVLWVLAGVAVQTTASALTRTDRTLAAAFLCAACAVPVFNISRNFAANDLSHDYAAQVFFDGLFERMPDRTAIVRENFAVDRMVNYKLAGERAARGRDIRIISADPDQVRRALGEGFTVLAFGLSAGRMRERGLDAGWSPWPVPGERLPDWVRHLPDGARVAMALPAFFSADVARESAGVLSRLGASGDQIGNGSYTNLVFFGVRGGRAVLQESGHGKQELVVPGGPSTSPTAMVRGPGLRLGADVFDAWISRDSRTLLRTNDGMAVAVWNADGTLRDAFVVSAASQFRVPLTRSELSLFELRLPSAHATLDSAATDVTRLTRGGLFFLSVVPGAEVTVVVSTPVVPNIRVLSRTSPALAIDVDRCPAPDCGSAAADVPARPSEGRAPLTRLRARVPAGASVEMATIAIGAVPDSALARSSLPGSRLQPVDTTGMLSPLDQDTGRLLMANNEHAFLLGHGWSAVDFDETGPFRRLEQGSATFVLPVASGAARQIAVEAWWDGCAGARIALDVNGVELPPHDLLPGWHAYTWDLPAQATDAVALQARLRAPIVACATPSTVTVSTIDLERGKRSH